VSGELVHSRMQTGEMPTIGELGRRLALKGLVPTLEFAEEHDLDIGDSISGQGSPSGLSSPDDDGQGIDNEFIE